MIFQMGKGLLQHPGGGGGLKGGSAPCEEIFVFDELKNQSFQALFLVKISLKFTWKIPRKNG